MQVAHRVAFITFVWLCSAGSPSAWAAEPGTSERAAPAPAATEPAAGAAPRWHDSTLALQQRATAQTFGVGPDYQSSDPYYDFQIYVRPRYYLTEGDPLTISLRAQLLAAYEATNSDVTTRRGELLLEDTLVSPVFGWKLDDRGDQYTNLELGLPRLVIPTAKASYLSGKILGVGVRLFADQGLELRKGRKFLAKGHVAARIGYQYDFVRYNVPDRSTIARLRTDLAGHVASNDQLSGAAFADHSGTLHGIAGADLYRDRLALELEAGLDPMHKRVLAEQAVCNLPTGCVLPRRIDDARRWVMTTFFDVHLEGSLLDDMLTLSLGYEHITGQLGPDGRRRSLFYGPDAKFYLAADLVLDKLYGSLAGKPAPSAVALAR